MMAWTRILPDAPGVATDGFSGLLADETDADGAAEETEGAGDVASKFSEDGIHVVDGFVVAVAAVRTRGTLPAVKSQWCASAACPSLCSSCSWSSPWLQMRPM